MTEAQLIGLTLVILLILSAIPVTATAAMYVGFFLLTIAWISAYQTGNLLAFGNELFGKGGQTNP